MPYESRYYRYTDTSPFIEFSKPEYVWEDDEFENEKRKKTKYYRSDLKETKSIKDINGNL